METHNSFLKILKKDQETFFLNKYFVNSHEEYQQSHYYTMYSLDGGVTNLLFFSLPFNFPISVEMMQGIFYFLFSCFL